MELLRKNILVFIIALAAFLRLFSLSTTPPGLTWDEAALGYNAYSLLQTGKDEYGNMLPLNLKSFGDYKPAVYAYLDIPFVKIFGLNELAVRLPSALFGIATVLLIYLVSSELFKNRSISLLSAFFLAISPWHLQFSRPAFEANAALFFNTLGLYLFLKGLKSQKFLPFSALFLGVSLFTYQASRIFIPILIIGLILIYKGHIKRSTRSLVGLVIISFFVILLVLNTFLRGQTKRLTTLNIFNYQRSDQQKEQISHEDGLAVNSQPFNILHGEWWAYTKGLEERYLIYFSPKTLFIDGGLDQRQSVPGMGLLYFFSIILIPVGAIYLIRRNDTAVRFLFFWILISPIPAILARDLVSPLRALNMVIALVILEGAGLYSLIQYLRKQLKIIYFLGLFTSGIIIVFNLVTYLDSYYTHASFEYSRYFLYGHKEIISSLKDTTKYHKVVMSDYYGQPYIFYLFYTKYPPAKFQEQAILDQPNADVGTVRKIDNIEFRHIYWPNDRNEKSSLFIGTLEELPDKDVLPFPEFNTLKETNFLNNEPAFKIVETK